jgi:hypothetical protein
MPLIDLKTNLKTLRFGNDQPGYGSSGLPYIQTAIPDLINATGTFNPIFRPGSTGNLDYPIRGGDIKFNIGTQTFTLSTQIDKTRIRKFFEDAPRGKAFIEKQIGLQLSNPKVETGNTLYGFGQSATLPGLLENTRVYNKGLNTLAQVGASGTGAHAIRHGLLPFNPFQKHYYDIVNAQNINDQSENNRLLILNNLKMSNNIAQIADANQIGNINTVNTLGISLNKNFIFQYWGGPGSTYGIGVTTIKRVVDTTKLRSFSTMNYDQLRAQNSNFGNAIPKIQDFRDQTGLALDGSYVPWGNNQIDKRFYVAAGSYKDKMNLLYPFGFNNNVAPWEYNPEATDDLIKFVFEAISNDDTNYSTAIFFRAFLTAGITDNNSAQLNAFRYMGRGENFYTYQGFDRSIAFSFRVAAGSRDELIPMYNRLNALQSQVYPDYSPNQGIMRAPIVRITIGDYLYRVPGFLESVNFTIDNTTPWEIDLDGDLAQLPQVVDVNISFKPIMDTLPQRSSLLVKKNQLQTLNNEVQGTLNNPALIANNGKVIRETFTENVNRYETNAIVADRSAERTSRQNEILQSGVSKTIPDDVIQKIKRNTGIPDKMMPDASKPQNTAISNPTMVNISKPQMGININFKRTIGNKEQLENRAKQLGLNTNSAKDALKKRINNLNTGG